MQKKLLTRSDTRTTFPSMFVAIVQFEDGKLLKKRGYQFRPKCWTPTRFMAQIQNSDMKVNKNDFAHKTIKIVSYWLNPSKRGRELMTIADRQHHLWAREAARQSESTTYRVCFFFALHT